MKFDLLLIHPPSYFYFREEKRIYGPIADVVPSTPIFDMYPYGFFSIVYYLSKKGMKASIHNAAALMILNEDYRLEDFLSKIEAKLYGIDLHWLVHSHGALETARLIKQVKGEVPIVLGGLSASIYWAEILSNYDFIDYVLIGDNTEESIEKLIRYVDGEENIENIEGLAYRDNGKLRLNPLRRPPEKLDNFFIDFHYLFKHVLNSGDILSFIPFSSFISNPIGAVIPFKGCKFNCATCGGGKSVYQEYLGRENISSKSPNVLAEEIASINAWSKIPVFVVGDLQLIGGERYLDELIRNLRERDFDAPIFFEFYYPPPLSILERMIKASHTVYLQISPETQEEVLRIKFGRAYNNIMLEKFIERSQKIGFERVDLYFMHGIPFQTYDIAIKLTSYIEHLININKKARIDMFVSPLAPFIDPGSPAFKFPFMFGYNLRAKFLRDHVELIKTSRTWIDMLNYESMFMSNQELSLATAKTALELIKLKLKHGIIDENLAERQINLIEAYLKGTENPVSYDEKIIVPFEELYETLDLGKLLRDPYEVVRVLLNITKFGENS